MLGLRRGQYGADAGIKERYVGADAESQHQPLQTSP